MTTSNDSNRTPSLFAASPTGSNSYNAVLTRHPINLSRRYRLLIMVVVVLCLVGLAFWWSTGSDNDRPQTASGLADELNHMSASRVAATQRDAVGQAVILPDQTDSKGQTISRRPVKTPQVATGRVGDTVTQPVTTPQTTKAADNTASGNTAPKEQTVTKSDTDAALLAMLLRYIEQRGGQHAGHTSVDVKALRQQIASCPNAGEAGRAACITKVCQRFQLDVGSCTAMTGR